MKRMTYFVMALALVLGFTQCKKEQPTPQTQGVRITLNVNGGNSNSRVDVNPTGHTDPDYATVTFEEGDVIYVGNNGAYVGCLTYNGSNFSGNIDDSNLNEADYLHFYFMGNKGPADSEPTETVSITDQTAKYPVISYAHSTDLFDSDVHSYSAKLQNYCAIVKFTTTDLPQTTDITITGMNNTVAVNFGANNAATSATGDPYTFSSTGDGEITLHAESSTERWAILLPQGEVATATASAEGYATEGAFTVPAIAANDYKAEGIGVELVAAAPAVPEGAINGKFTINGDGDQVYFSKGNLQYQASTSTWKFATNQYDYIGGANSRISENYSGWIDLFGWGTSGYNHGATAYQPWATSTNSEEYNPYGATNTNLNSNSGKADWGYNAIDNGGNQENSGWRTLTMDEWAYVFNSRTTSSGIRYAKAKVNNKNGVILLPDNWTTSTYTLSNTNSSGANFTSNTISAENWANTLEANGAVFLPAAGDRSRTSVRNPGSYGYYWSASYGNSTSAGRMDFSSDALNTSRNNNRPLGYSVRLARNAQ